MKKKMITIATAVSALIVAISMQVGTTNALSTDETQIIAEAPAGHADHMNLVIIVNNN